MEDMDSYSTIFFLIAISHWGHILPGYDIWKKHALHD